MKLLFFFFLMSGKLLSKVAILAAWLHGLERFDSWAQELMVVQSGNSPEGYPLSTVMARPTQTRIPYFNQKTSPKSFSYH